MSLDPGVKDKLLRIVLRSLPLLPGQELYDLLSEVKKSQSDVDSQVREALDSIKKTSDLVSRLETSLRDRSEKLEHLRKEHERYSELAEIDAKKAEALLAQIEVALGRNLGRERWIAFGINIVAGLILFALGVTASEPIKQWLANVF